MYDNEGGEKIWSTLLAQVHATAVSRLNAYGAYGSTIGPQLLILGSERVGKTKLISNISRSDDVSSAMGLAYHCVTFKEDQPEVTETLQLGIWCLDADPSQSHLLRFALNESNIWHTMLLICVSLAEPWSMLSELQMWLRIVQQHVARLKLAPGELKALRCSIKTQFRSYIDPAGVGASKEDGDENGIKGAHPNAAQQRGRRGSHNVAPTEGNAAWPYSPLHPLTLPNGETVENDSALALGTEEIAENPTGVPLVVVLTKVDCFTQLEDECGFTDEHLDAIQYHLRQLCLQYEASLIYTSTKEAINTDLLFRYLKHRLYDLPFSTSACLIDPVAVFIPSGWDNEHRLALLRKNLPESVTNGKFGSNFPRSSKARSKFASRGKKISPTESSARADDSLLLQAAEDEQTFLARIQLQMQQMQTPSPGEGSSLSKIGNEMTSPISLPGNVTSRTGTISSGGQQTGSNLTDKEAVLSSFFNSLLTRKNLSNESTPTSPAPPSTSGLGNGNTSEQKQLPSVIKKISLTSSRAAQEQVGGDKGKSSKTNLASSRTISEPDANEVTLEQQNKLVAIEKQKQDRSAVKKKTVERKTDTTVKNSPPNLAVKSAGEIKSAELNANSTNDGTVSGNEAKNSNDNPPKDKKPGQSKDLSVQLETIDKAGNQERENEKNILSGDIQNVTAKSQKKPAPKSTANPAPGSQPTTFETTPSGSRTPEGNQSNHQESTNRSSSSSNESIKKTQKKLIINDSQKPKLTSTVAEEQQRNSVKPSRPENKLKESSITAQKAVKQTEPAKSDGEEPKRPGQKESTDKANEE